MKYLADQGADIHAYNDFALRFAAGNGHLDVVKYLTDLGADIRVDNDSAQRNAAQKGHLDVVKYLADQGADIHADYDYALRNAAYSGHLDILKYLVDQGADIRAGSDHILRTAAGNGHLDMVKYLADQGADIHVDNDYALRYAAQSGHLDVVKYLVDHGADIHAYNDYALLRAAQSGHLDMVKYLTDQGADIHADNNYALRYAAGNGRLDVVKYLLDQGADIHAHYDSSLRLAAQNGHLDMVKYLADQGADIRAYNDSALRFAAQNGHLDVVKYLADQGADIHADNNYALRQTARNGHLDMVKYLADQGADMSLLTENQMKQMESYERWTVMHKNLDRVPPGLLFLSPHFFHTKTYNAVKDMLAKEGYENGQAAQYSYHISGLFRSEDRVLQYLEKWGEAGKQPLHDIGQHIRLPENGRPDLNSWGDAVLQHGPKMARFVKFSDRLQKPEKSECGRFWSYTKTKEKIAERAFEKGHENPALASLCFEHGWDEDEFNDALKQIKKYHKKYAGHNGKKTQNRLPDITIDGEHFDKPGYQFYKLPDGDLRGLLLGEFTNCCQHLAGEGEDCAKHGFLSENGGFYVVADKKNNEIVAQSWAWRGSKGELVFDSLETLGKHLDAGQWQSLCQEFGKALEHGKDQSDITAFHIGKGGGTLKMAFNKAASLAVPKDYNKYRDSKNKQYCVWKR